MFMSLQKINGFNKQNLQHFKDKVFFEFSIGQVFLLIFHNVYWQNKSFILHQMEFKSFK